MSIIHFTLDTDRINDIQLESMRLALKRTKQAHFTNLQIRINGAWEYPQADWLKHFVEVINTGTD